MFAGSVRGGVISLVTGAAGARCVWMLGCVWVEERESLHVDVSNFQREVKE